MKNILKKIYWGIYNLKIIPCNLFAKIQVNSMGKNCKFHKLCRLTPKVIIGNNCHFNGIKIQGKGKVVIGDNFHSGEGVNIITSDHNYDNGQSIPYDNTYITDDVIIDNNVWVGMNVIILKGVHLGEGCIIQAGSLVNKDVPPYKIAGGHPAKVFSSRNMDHYLKLKNNNKYY